MQISVTKIVLNIYIHVYMYIYFNYKCIDNKNHEKKTKQSVEQTVILMFHDHEM